MIVDAAFYRQYEKLVHRYAWKFRYIGMEHEDLVQDLWLYLVKMVPTFDESRGVPIGAFVAKMIAWRCLSMMARERRDRRLGEAVEFIERIHAMPHDADATPGDLSRLLSLCSEEEIADLTRWIYRGSESDRGGRDFGRYSFERARQRYMSALSRLKKIA